MLQSHTFETLMRLQDTLDAFRASGWLSAGPSGTGAFPPLNVFSKGDDVVIVAEAPGLSKEDLDVQVKGKTIQISGRKSVHSGAGAGLHRRERTAGTFRRAITVPVEIDADKVKAEYRDGMLALFLPRAERDKPRSIAIA